MDFDERISGSNMYLPSCTYYADFSGLPHYLTQSQTSCPSVTYPYHHHHQSSAPLPQVPSVRDVAFRDYGIDASGKWHHGRGSLTHCYTEDMVHRDGWPSQGKGASGAAGHPGSSGLYTGGVGRNGVLPQAFDQFFDSPEGSTTPGAQGGAAAVAAAAEAAAAAEKQAGKRSPAPGEQSCSPRSSSGHSEERQSKSSGKKLLKPFYMLFYMHVRFMEGPATKLCYKLQDHVLGIEIGREDFGFKLVSQHFQHAPFPPM